jgi:hypothetical protein
MRLVCDDRRSFDDLDNVVTVYARNSRDAIDLLGSNAFHELWLDYDLGWGNLERHDTGMRVVDYLTSESARFQTLNIVTITDLDDYARQMVDALSRAGLTATISDEGHRWNERHL